MRVYMLLPFAVVDYAEEGDLCYGKLTSDYEVSFKTTKKHKYQECWDLDSMGSKWSSFHGRGSGTRWSYTVIDPKTFN